MKVCNLASGSKGNATIIIGQYTSILIDNGLSVRELKKRCEDNFIDIKSISAIFVSHEHLDHIKGVDSLSLKLNIPVYIHPQSLQMARKKFGAFCNAVPTEFIYPIEFEDLSIQGFRVNHDAEYTVGFSVTDGIKTFTIATDLGKISDKIFERLAESDYVMIESNYDELMLLSGAYPPALKKRIRGINGHLSNEDCANIISRLYLNYHKNRFMLGHISQNNNTLENVKEAIKSMMQRDNIESSMLDIKYAHQDFSEGVIEI